jgi:hypothetical protein
MDGDTSVNQTCVSNLPKETWSGSQLRQESRQDVSSKRGSGVIRATRSIDAARVAAERCWTNDLLQRFSSQPVTYAEIINAIDPVLQEADTDAELRRPGGGVAYIIEALGVFTGVSIDQSQPTKQVIATHRSKAARSIPRRGRGFNSRTGLGL